MSRPSEELNVKHSTLPVVGDYWHEMFCPYLLVLDVTSDGVVITRKTREVDSGHFEFDFEGAEEITLKELLAIVSYRDKPGKFVADVVPEMAPSTARGWKKAGGKFKPITQREEELVAADLQADKRKTAIERAAREIGFALGVNEIVGALYDKGLLVEVKP